VIVEQFVYIGGDVYCSKTICVGKQKPDPLYEKDEPDIKLHWNTNLRCYIENEHLR
jgi:hypothetical protein